MTLVNPEEITFKGPIDLTAVLYEQDVGISNIFTDGSSVINYHFKLDRIRVYDDDYKKGASFDELFEMKNVQFPVLVIGAYGDLSNIFVLIDASGKVGYEENYWKFDKYRLVYHVLELTDGHIVATEVEDIPQREILEKARLAKDIKMFLLNLWM